MANNILIEFKHLLKEVSWMDAKSLKNALDKADAIRAQIGYADMILNNTYIEKLYAVNLPIREQFQILTVLISIKF